MWRTHYCVALLVALLCWWASSTTAATLGVCSSGCPFANIQPAIAAAQANDLVRVEAGVYAENVTGVAVSPLYIEGVGNVTILTTNASSSQWLSIGAGATVRLNGTITLVGSILVTGGTLETRGRLNVTQGLASIQVLRIYNGAQWLHYGHVEIATTAYIAVNLQGATWNQFGSSRLTTQTGIAVDSIWNQYGRTELVSSAATGFGAHVTGTWNQDGALDVTAWNSSTGVMVPLASTYLQRNTSSFSLDRAATGINVMGNWTQAGGLYMNVNGGCTGVVLNNDNTTSWWQQSSLTLDVTGPSATGVSFVSSAARWLQQGLVDIVVSGSRAAGVRFSESSQVWEQLSGVTIAVPGPFSCGVDLGMAGPSVWQFGAIKPTVSATGRNSSGQCPVPLPSLLVEAVKALINDTTPSVAVVPRDSAPDAAGQKAQVDFLSLREVTPAGDLVWAAQLQDGWVHSGNGTSNVSYPTTTFTSRLANSATLTYEFATFNADIALTLANNYTFSVTPAFFKFSLRLDRWNWSSTDNKLEFQMVIDPPFATPEVRANTPQANMTTIFLPSGEGSQGGTLVRLLDFGLTNTSQRVACSSAANPGSSSITITFAHFDSDLDYDPDISLLLGGRKDDDGGGGGSGGTEWVIAVAVAIPVAVAVVALVIVVALTVTFVRRRRRTAALAVNFDNDGRDGGAEEL